MPDNRGHVLVKGSKVCITQQARTYTSTPALLSKPAALSRGAWRGAGSEEAPNDETINSDPEGLKTVP